MENTPRRLIHDPVANMPVLVPGQRSPGASKRPPKSLLSALAVAVLFFGAADFWANAFGRLVAGTAPIVAVKRSTVASEG